MKPRQLGASGYMLEHAMKEVFTLTHNGMKKQTAVEWLVEQLKDMEYDLRLIPNTIQQAKEMEKEQHNITWKESRIVKVVDTYHEKETSFDDYYSETFKK